MRRSTSRGIREGLAFGLVAGLLFAVFEVIATVAMGGPALNPFRMFSSVVLGVDAMQEISIGTAFVVGLIVHLALSGAFGIIYGVVSARMSGATRVSWGKQASMMYCAAERTEHGLSTTTRATV